MNPALPTQAPQRGEQWGEGWGEGPLAEALAAASEPARVLLLASLLQQSQRSHVDVGDAADGMQTVHLRLDLTPAALARVLQAGPSPQALAALIGLAAI